MILGIIPENYISNVLSYLYLPQNFSSRKPNSKPYWKPPWCGTLTKVTRLSNQPFHKWTCISNCILMMMAAGRQAEISWWWQRGQPGANNITLYIQVRHANNFRWSCPSILFLNIYGTEIYVSYLVLMTAIIFVFRNVFQKICLNILFKLWKKFLRERVVGVFCWIFMSLEFIIEFIFRIKLRDFYYKSCGDDDGNVFPGFSFTYYLLKNCVFYVLFAIIYL